MHNRAHRRGVTLLESMIALGVFAIGITGVFGLIARVHAGNRSVMAQAGTLDAFALVAAEIRDARCDFPATMPGVFDPTMTDPALQPTGGGWIDTPRGAITRVGELEGSPPLHVSYRVALERAPVNPPPQVVALDVDVRVREVQHDPVKDNAALEAGSWIRVFPVKKLCNPRYDETYRGEY
jgi:prepilin-type N-terminal cleavage/methylation domain-containing protein